MNRNPLRSEKAKAKKHQAVEVTTAPDPLNTLPRPT
jgi:hypothetical protein